MLLVVNKNNKTQKVSVLDTDDMVVETYTYDVLKLLVNLYDLDISGYPLHDSSGILLLDLLSPFKSNYAGYFVLTPVDLNKRVSSMLTVQGINCYGTAQFYNSQDKYYYISCFSEADIQNLCISPLKSMLLYINYMINCGTISDKSYIINALYNSLMFQTKESYKVQNWGSYLVDIAKHISFVEYDKYFIFYDEDIVFKVKKEVFENLKKSVTYNTKSTMMKKGIELSKDSKYYILSGCEEARLQKGKKYKIPKNNSLRKLYVEEGAELCGTKLPSYRLETFECYDSKVFNKIVHSLESSTDIIIPDTFLMIVLDTFTDEELTSIYRIKIKSCEGKDYIKTCLLEYMHKHLYVRGSSSVNVYGKLIEIAKLYDLQDIVKSYYSYDSEYVMQDLFMKSLGSVYSTLRKCLKDESEISNFLFRSHIYSSVDTERLMEYPASYQTKMYLCEELYNKIVLNFQKSAQSGLMLYCKSVIQDFCKVCSKYNLKLEFNAAGRNGFWYIDLSSIDKIYNELKLRVNFIFDDLKEPPDDETYTINYYWALISFIKALDIMKNKFKEYGIPIGVHFSDCGYDGFGFVELNSQQEEFNELQQSYINKLKEVNNRNSHVFTNNISYF